MKIESKTTSFIMLDFFQQCNYFWSWWLIFIHHSKNQLS